MKTRKEADQERQRREDKHPQNDEDPPQRVQGLALAAPRLKAAQ